MARTAPPIHDAAPVIARMAKSNYQAACRGIRKRASDLSPRLDPVIHRDRKIARDFQRAALEDILSRALRPPGLDNPIAMFEQHLDMRSEQL